MTVSVRDAQTIIGMVERGDLAHELTQEIEAVIQRLRDDAGPKTAAKGSVTLKLNFVVQGVSIEIDGEIASKTPKRKRAKSVYFLTSEGRISTEHPQQPDMFPREARAREA